MAGFTSVEAVHAAAADGALNAALKAAGNKQFGVAALEMIAGNRPFVRTTAPTSQAADSAVHKDGEGCPICMAPLPAAGSSLLVRTPCGHEFCLSCVQRLVRNTASTRTKCPLCRRGLDDGFIKGLSEAEDEEENRAWMRDVRTHMRLTGGGCSSDSAVAALAATAAAEHGELVQPPPGSASAGGDEEGSGGDGLVLRLLLGNTHDSAVEPRLSESFGTVFGQGGQRWTLYLRRAPLPVRHMCRVHGTQDRYRHVPARLELGGGMEGVLSELTDCGCCPGFVFGCQRKRRRAGNRRCHRQAVTPPSSNGVRPPSHLVVSFLPPSFIAAILFTVATTW